MRSLTGDVIYVIKNEVLDDAACFIENIHSQKTTKVYAKKSADKMKKIVTALNIVAVISFCFFIFSCCRYYK